MNSQKCIFCGRPATKEMSVHDPEIGKSSFPACDRYPVCFFTIGDCSENSGFPISSITTTNKEKSE